jgi:8-oxo-(d)GTP phosphatase
MAKEPVRAAGAIVWRDHVEIEGTDRPNLSALDSLQVLVVHRPHYDDWSFPKGKRDENESDLACALREVEEETGLPVSAGVELPTVEYLDHKLREKTVAYWAATVLPTSSDQAFVPNDEVDEMRWLPLKQARELLTYPIDQLLLDEFSALDDRFGVPEPGVATD